MMNLTPSKVKSAFQGDPFIWAIVFILSVIGILAVYSSTGTISFSKQQGDTEHYLLRHLGFIVVGWGIMYLTHKIPFKYYAKISFVMLIISVVLLYLTLVVGYKINNAARVIPIFGFTIQPSDMAKLFLAIFIARFMSKNQDEVDKPKIFGTIIGVIILVIIPIIPENLSTSLVIIATSTLIMIMGRIKMKFIIIMGLILASVASIFYLFLMNIDMDKYQGTRMPTWKKRIETYMGKDEDGSGGYQQLQAKIAVASGGFWGKGPGNSTQRNFLPHPYSDFIFAIIVEEYGFVGGFILVVCYLGLIYRSLRMVVETQRSFAALVVLGISVTTTVQALIHMGVSIGNLPVTGLTLPLVSMGGTSILFNSMAFGIILGVSRHIQQETMRTSVQGTGTGAVANENAENHG
jgi:cell division protein FtsW